MKLYVQFSPERILQGTQREFEFPVTACKEPKRSYHRGRSWDSMTKTIDGNKVEFHLDTTWGHYQYFEFNGKWYKIPLSIESCHESTYDISVFTTKKKNSDTP